MSLPPGQQLVARDKWPLVGERAPLDPPGPWQVQLAGDVEHPLALDLAALAACPRTEMVVDIHCVTRWSKPGVRFAGVSLADLLAEARPWPMARFVSFVAHSARGHSTSLLLADALALGALVATEVDGSPLAREHGGPVRVVVPGRYFYKSLKWLARIELLERDQLGYWEREAGYHNTADPWREQRFLAPSLARQEMASIIAARSFRGRDLRGLDAQGHDLSGLDAAEALLRDADFSDAQLDQASFERANLSNARFLRASLRGASFRDADLEGADFRGASLVAASFCDEADSMALRATIDSTTLVDPAALDELTPIQQAFVASRLDQ